MSELALPEGWVSTKLGNYMYLKNGYAFKSAEYLPQDNKNIPLIRIGDIQDNTVSTASSVFVKANEQAESFVVNKGDLLIAMSGATTGKMGVYQESRKAYQNQRVGNIKFVSQNLGSESFRNYLIQSLKQTIHDIAYGGAQPNISAKAIENIEITLPSLNEQEVISQILNQYLTTVSQIQARLDAIPKLIEKFRQSVLSEAATGRLTKHWRESNKLCDWDQVHFKSLLKHGIQNGLYKPKSYYGSGSKIIRIDSFYDGQIIDWDKIKRVKLEDDEAEKWKLELDNILINRVNSIEYLGKCALVDNLPEVAVFESNIMRLSVDTDKVIPAFIVTYLKSIQGISELRKNAKLAVNQASINQQDVGSVMCPLPSIEEQQEIVKRVKGFFTYADQIEKSVSTAKARVDNLTQSILYQAFTGNLTAEWREQNPELISGENSAEALLAKIKAEKQVSGKKVKKA